MEIIFRVAVGVLICTSFICLYRGIKGPSVTDRILVANTIGTKVIIILSLFSNILHNALYLDVAIVYALASFMVTILAAKYKEDDKLI